MQSTLPAADRLHVALIMDGNGRWATNRGLPRTAGHRAGVTAVRRVVESAPGLGITTLSLFAFSSDNWRRPADEVAALMALLRGYLRAETRRLVESDARLTVIGRRDRLQPSLRREIERAEKATSNGRGLHLRIAFDYSSREAIAGVAMRWKQHAEPSLARFGQTLAGEPDCAEVDLLIRTGGEKRLSDFLLWESAYAELWFSDTMWPEFGGDELSAAVDDYRHRERRFGGLPQTSPATAAR